MDVRNASVHGNSSVKGAAGSLEHGLQNVMLIFAIPYVDVQIHSRTHRKCSEELLAKPDIETVA